MAEFDADNGWGLTNLTTDEFSGNTTDTSKPYPSVLQFVVMWTVSVLIVVLNIVVFAVVPKMKTLQPGCFMGMLSLAVADLGLGVSLVISLSVNTSIHFQVHRLNPVCLYQGFCLSVFACVSVTTLTYMNIDRLVTMAYPLHYPQHMTRKRAFIILAIIWLVIIGLVSLNFRSPSANQTQYYKYVFCCVNSWDGNLSYNLSFGIVVQVIPTFAIMVCFVGIFYIAIHRKKQANQSSSQTKRDLRIFRTLGIMTFGFYVALMPYFAMVAIPELIMGKSIHPISDFVTFWLVASNSFWNAIIYLLTMPNFRKTLQDSFMDTRSFWQSSSG